MFKFLSRLSFISILFENGRAFFRTMLAILLFFIVERIYAKWATISGDLYPSFSITVLSIYTLLQLAIVIWLLFSLKRISNSKQARRKIISKPKAIPNSEKNFDKFKDIDTFPDLKK